MRTIAAALCLCLLAAAVPAQQVERVHPSGNLLTRHLDEANVHPPARIGRLTVFGVTLNRADRLPGVLTMDQALAKNVLLIEELASAHVNRARFVNKSASQMIFLMAGEVLTGGKQNRTLATDALLGPNSATVLPIYCVQKGRWRGTGGFAKVTAVAPQAVRERAAQDAGQDAVWKAVARANRRLNSATGSDDLAAAMAKPENARRFSGLRRRIAPKLPAGCAGVVVAVGANIVGADLFNSPELFAAMRDKVLDSYLSQYGDQATVRHGVAGRPSQLDVRDYLQACYRARFTPADTRGVGKVYDIRGARFGQTLAYEGTSAVRSRVPVRPRRCMVHTALMQQVVPVRPTPVPGRPVPLPRPRPWPEVPRR